MIENVRNILKSHFRSKWVCKPIKHKFLIVMHRRKHTLFIVDRLVYKREVSLIKSDGPQLNGYSPLSESNRNRIILGNTDVLVYRYTWNLFPKTKKKRG